MRDLKFRAWIKNENKMGEVTQLSFTSPCGSIFAVSVDSTPVGFFKKDDIELLQYTGLKDRLGKEIFEGDILRVRYFNQLLPDSMYKSEEEKKSYIKQLERLGYKFDSKKDYHMDEFFEVKFRNGCFSPFVGMFDSEWGDFSTEDLKKCEVIGNIFEKRNNEE